MRLLLLLLALLIFGCAQTETLGLTPDDLPVGTQVDVTAQFIQKEPPCVMGFLTNLYTIEDPSLCENLTDSHYHLQGTVIGYTTYQSISSPIISVAGLERLGPEYAIADSIEWSLEQNHTIPLQCSPEVMDLEIEFVSEDGTYSSRISIPDNPQGTGRVELEGISFGTYTQDMSNYLIIKTKNPGLEASEYDNTLKIDGRYHACHRLATEDGYSYLYCQVFEQVDPQDSFSLALSFYNSDIELCSGVAEIN